ncbi:dynein heavy chain 3, axonemal-like [Pollicipes pollicipes]|uniref:dynein heavy chain 3, axonemal-like n=1 Tax=Pollicipes pollicipes TaxID=41117 RepID=UPI0018849A7C|nr:dynein heavy chain 3, axonemal-like [Pollicipes pollicipes]
MVEDLNMILNLGDVPNLYPADEKAEILEKMQTIAKDMGRKVDSAPLALYNFFIELVRANLHVVVAMSPIGDAFRNRLRMFPSLINCCTIDWFTAWPEDALERVAHHFLRDVPDMDEDLRLGCVFVCQHFHESVRVMSQRYLAELNRHNYVTPTSYLELILAFKALLQRKRDDILTLRQRYVTGLEKLEFAASQVSVMQDELTSLQPQLIETSAQTEKLMIKIEQDTMEVEAKKELLLLTWMSVIFLTVPFFAMSMMFMGATPEFRCADGQPTNATFAAPCRRWLYDDRDGAWSVVSQWDLVCERRPLLSTIQSTVQLGGLLGSLVSGYLGDRYGRRLVYLGMIVLYVGAGLISAAASSYELFVACRFVTGVGWMGVVSSSFVLIVERHAARAYQESNAVVGTAPF